MALSNQFNLGTNNVDGLSNFTQSDTLKPLPSMSNLSTSQTVQGQMANLMQNGNPLMQRATTRASQAANKRGLLNSSMGVQAGQEAALSAALPIAQADAQAANTQALTNQGYMNQFSTAQQAQNYRKDLADQAYQQQVGTGLYGNITDGTVAPTGFVGGGGLIASQGEQARLTSAQQQANDIEMQTAGHTQQTSLQDDAQSQQTAMQTAGHTQQTSLQDDAQSQQTAMQSAEHGQQTSLQSSAHTQQTDIQDDSQTQQTEVQSAEHDQQIILQDDSQEQETRLRLDTNLFNEFLQQADEGTRSRLISLESSFNSKMQSSKNASSLWGGILNLIAGIQSDPDITAENRETAINNIVGEGGFGQSALALIESYDTEATNLQTVGSDSTSTSFKQLYESPLEPVNFRDFVETNKDDPQAIINLANDRGLTVSDIVGTTGYTEKQITDYLATPQGSFQGVNVQDVLPSGQATVATNPSTVTPSPASTLERSQVYDTHYDRLIDMGYSPAASKAGAEAGVNYSFGTVATNPSTVTSSPAPTAGQATVATDPNLNLAGTTRTLSPSGSNALPANQLSITPAPHQNTAALEQGRVDTYDVQYQGFLNQGYSPAASKAGAGAYVNSYFGNTGVIDRYLSS